MYDYGEFEMPHLNGTTEYDRLKYKNRRPG